MAAKTLIKMSKQGIEIVNAELTATQHKRIVAAWKDLEKRGIGFIEREEKR
jgi:hypothetical protein